MTHKDTTSPPRRPESAVGVVVLDGDSVLLIRRSKPPREDQWSIPGGRQELGETVHEAALREVFEETGLTVKLTGLLDVVDGIFKSPDGLIAQHYTLIDFSARPLSGALQAGDDAKEAKWVARAELIDVDLWSETRRIIDLAFRREELHDGANHQN
jgi:ADP-ribose pyrophosphatase YjhB (NUDIX family)